MFWGKSKAQTTDQTMSSTTPRIPESTALFQNCEVLTTEWGSRVYLLGTNGFCKKCLLNISKVIQQLQPSVVSLQCCSTRLDDIKLNEEDALRKLQISSVSLYLRMLLTTLLGNGLVSALLFKQTVLNSQQSGLASEADFRRALTEVKKIPNCKLHLADIPVEVLEEKSWGVPGVREKLTYARRLYEKQQKQQSSPEDEHDRESDKEYRQCEIEREFSSLPAFKRIFISDRNRYLTYSLKKAAEPTPADKTPVVLGIVRNEHVEGIKANWDTVDLDADKLATLEKNYALYEGLKYGAVIMTITFFYTRRLRNRKAWDNYFNVKRR
ncbi:traB domain-containing protein-like [Ostrea edulis]|uniref:traB domain-containing protein-like n=1 Tax=Ostrea edulis TaxID=37623 RepID=UPI0024AE8DF2|nr:traB domain-containing protein-like [Ostrea edulis]